MLDTAMARQVLTPSGPPSTGRHIFLSPSKPDPAPARRRRRLPAIVFGLLTLLGLLIPAVVTTPAAMAGPCQTCEDEPPPPPGPPGPPPARYSVTVKSIQGILNNDNSIQFHDEVYLEFNQQKYWGPVSVGDLERESGYDVNTNIEGATRYPNVSTVFIGSVGISLWDDDNTSADDYLGSVTMYANNSWSGVDSTIDLYGSGAHYKMLVNVRRIS